MVDEDVQIYGYGVGVRGWHFVEQTVASPGLTVLDQEILELFAAGDRVVVSMAQTYRRGVAGWPASTARCTAR